MIFILGMIVGAFLVLFGALVGAAIAIGTREDPNKDSIDIP